MTKPKTPEAAPAGDDPKGAAGTAKSASSQSEVWGSGTAASEAKAAERAAAQKAAEAEAARKAAEAEAARKAAEAEAARKAAEAEAARKAAEAEAARKAAEAEAARKAAAEKAASENESSGFSFSKIKHALEHHGKKLLGIEETSKTTDNADKLTPEQRKKDGITDYVDPKTHRQFRYDNEGRIAEIASKNGLITTVSYGDGAKADAPAAVSVRNDASWKVVAHVEAGADHQVRIDQRTGDIVSAYSEKLRQAPGDAHGETNLHVRQLISPDGQQSITRTAPDGQRLDKLMLDANGVAYGKVEYHYATPQPGQTAKDVEVIGVQLDARQRPVHKFSFENSVAMETQKPSAREDITYVEKEHSTTERHELFDLSSGKAILNGQVEKTIDLERGRTEVHHLQFADGKTVVDQTAAFDKDGKPMSFVYNDAQKGCELSFSFDANGRPVEVFGDKGALGSKDSLLSFALVSVGGLGEKYAVRDLQEARLTENIGPTQPGQGERGSGTLVWRDGGGYAHAHVDNGTIYDANKTAIGTFKDNGEVTLTGNPPKTFNILTDESAGAAFHGTSSEQQRLDLCIGQGKGFERNEGLNGLLINPSKVSADGKQETLRVIGGNVFDSKGEFLEHIDKFGKLTFANDREPKQDAGTDMNSILKDGWLFTGNENGQHRQFDVGPMSNGKLCLPELDATTNKPKLDASGNPLPAVEYEVRMGMIIDKVTGEQIGKFTPPTDVGDRLEGGSITTGVPPKTVSLASFSRAVFEVKVMGQYSGRTVSGFALGAEVKADGSSAHTMGGLFNLGHARQITKDQLDDAKVKSEGTEADLTGIELAQRQQMRQDKVVNEILSSGLVTDDALRRLDAQTSNAKTAMMGDSIMRLKTQLDHPEYCIEDVPPKVDGTAKIPNPTEPGGIANFDIRQSVLYKHGSTVAIGTINPSDGSMTLLDAKNQPAAVRMNDIAGAVWHLEYPGKDGQKSQVDWFTLQHGHMRSAADLRRQAQDEIALAKALDSPPSEMTTQAVKRSEELAKRYDEVIEQAKKGIPNPPKDGMPAERGSLIEQLESGPRKYVRAEFYKEKFPPPKVIALHELTQEDCHKMTGAMRIGEEHFSIDHGKLRHMIVRNGALVPGAECGFMEPGYVANIDGREIKLSNESQLLLKFQIDGAKEHRIIGLGQPRTESDGSFVGGGLVEADELVRQAQAAKDEAAAGNKQYFIDKPWVTGGVTNWYGGDQEWQMEGLQETLTNQMNALTKDMDHLFVDGMSGTPITNNDVDHSVRTVHGFIRDMNLSARDELEISNEAAQFQQMTSNVAALTAITIMTGGSSTIVGAMGATELFGAELLVSMIGGGLASTVVRQTHGGGGRQAWDNFGAGVIEAGTITAGGKLTSLMPELKAIQAARLKPAAELTEAEVKLLGKETLQGFVKNKIADMAENKFAARALEAWRPANAVMQSSGFALAGSIREHNMNSQFTAEKLAMGSLWMLGGEYIGLAAKQLTSLGKVERTAEEIAALGPQRALRFQYDGTTPFTKFTDTFIQRMPEDFINNFFTSGTGASEQGIELERQRLENQLHISVSNEYLHAHMNLNNVLNYMLKASFEGAMSSPLTVMAHQATEVVGRRIQAGQERRAAALEREHQELTTGVVRGLELLEKLKERAQIDPMTGALNRLGFDRALHEAIENCTRHNKELSVVYVDLNNFKKLNDTIGYTAGDRALQAFKTEAERLLRPGDELARFGGDEYGILLPDTSNLTPVLERIQAIRVGIEKNGEVRILKEGETIGADGIEVTPALGGVVWKKGQTVSDVTKAADAAMFHNKKSKKDGKDESDRPLIHENPDVKAQQMKAEELARIERFMKDRNISTTANEFLTGKISLKDMAHYRERIREACREYITLIKEHPHTGLLNKEYTTQKVKAEMNRANRQNGEFNLVLLDLDNFKTVNDTFGHDMGDKVLNLYGDFLRGVKRSGDFVGSYGGDEGVILAREAKDTTRLMTVLDNFILAVGPNGIRQIDKSKYEPEALKKELKDNGEIPVGISAGQAKYELNMDMKTLEDAAKVGLKQQKDQHVIDGFRTPRVGEEHVSAIRVEELAPGAAYRIDFARLPEHAQKELLATLNLRHTQKHGDGEIVTYEHAFLANKTMEDFASTLYAIMKDMPDIRFSADYFEMKFGLEDRATAIETALNKIAKKLGNPAIKIVVDDAFLDSKNAEAAYSSGRGIIYVRQEQLLRGDLSFIGTLYHEFLHADQDAAMIRATAAEFLFKNPNPEKLLQLLDERALQEQIQIAHSHKTGLPYAKSEWLTATLASPEGVAWIKQRLERMTILKQDAEYERAISLRSAYRDKRQFREKPEELRDRVLLLERNAADATFKGEAVACLKQLEADAKVRKALFGEDILNSKYDESDSALMGWLKENPGNVRLVLEGKREEWKAAVGAYTNKLREETLTGDRKVDEYFAKMTGETVNPAAYQEPPNSLKRISRMELKAILYCMKQDQSNPAGPVFTDAQYAKALHQTLKDTQAVAKTQLSQVNYVNYIGNHYELESHYATALIDGVVARLFPATPDGNGTDTTGSADWTALGALLPGDGTVTPLPGDDEHTSYSLTPAEIQRRLEAQLKFQRESEDPGLVFDALSGGTPAQHLEIDGERATAEEKENDDGTTDTNSDVLKSAKDRELEAQRLRRRQLDANNVKGINLFRNDI